MKRYLPGDTWIGMLGGGQLGRMLTMEARRMGYKVLTWIGCPDSGPAGLADRVITDPFDSAEALETFCDVADVASLEFENIPRELLEQVAERIPLTPDPSAVITAQHREREKTFLSKHGFPCAWYQVVDSAAGLEKALAELPGEKGILKTAEFGYDGKGQLSVSKGDDASQVWTAFDSPRAVLEQRIDLAAELSVLVVRSRSGETQCYEPAENRHRNHILDLSIIPSALDPAILKLGQEVATRVAEALDYAGILAVEFFVDSSGNLLINELAPRPHNSGHHTIDACETSQFEQQLRMMCNLPIGNPRTHTPAVMWNLLGDLWQKGEPDWATILSTPGAHLHLYGKREARVGRKMGHVTFTGENALETAMKCRAAFGWKDE